MHGLALVVGWCRVSGLIPDDGERVGPRITIGTKERGCGFDGAHGFSVSVQEK